MKPFIHLFIALVILWFHSDLKSSSLTSANCQIYELEAYDIECNSDSTFLVTVNFLFDSVPGDLFDIKDRHHLLGTFNYDSLPVRLEVPVSGADYEFLKVTDHSHPDCHAAIEFMTGCGTPPSCHIYELEAYDIECNSDSTFLITVNFLFDSVPGDLFDIKDRHHLLGTFNYDSLPVRLEVPVSGADYEFLKVTDHSHPDCHAAIEFMADCASACAIFDLSYSNIECTSDSTYLVTINFEHQHTTNHFFDLSDREGIIGFFPYDSLPVRTEIKISGSEHEYLKISDNDNPGCFTEVEFKLECATSGSREIERTHASIWPNPVYDLLNISSEIPVEFYIVNISGKLMVRGKVNGTHQLDLSRLSSGIYFLQFRSDSGRRNFRIIKM